MGKSIDGRWQKHWRRSRFSSAPNAIASMSLQLAIPWRVALQQSPPPLHQPASFSSRRLKL
jgi:hypothetical protein